MSQLSKLELLGTMNRNRKPDDAASLAVDMVTAMNAKESPAMAFDKAYKDLTGNRLHTAMPGAISPARHQRYQYFKN